MTSNQDQRSVHRSSGNQWEDRENITSSSGAEDGWYHHFPFWFFLVRIRRSFWCSCWVLLFIISGFDQMWVLIWEFLIWMCSRHSDTTYIYHNTCILDCSCSAVLAKEIQINRHPHVRTGPSPREQQRPDTKTLESFCFIGLNPTPRS